MLRNDLMLRCFCRCFCVVLTDILIIALLSVSLAAQGAEPPRDQRTREFDLSGEKNWLDTGVDVRLGDTLRVTAAGTVRFPLSKDIGPDGIAKGWRDLLRVFTLNDANRGALIARIGDDPARPFLIGASRENRLSAAGRLYLGINQTENESPEGSFHVKIEITAGSESPAAVDESKLPVPTQAMLDQIPVRVKDADGNWGDRVNFLVVGSEDRVKQAFKGAGWVVVNRTVKDAIVQGVLATLSQQGYTQLPMSELRLFERPQDYGFAQADPFKVVASRHHFRVWKAPFQVKGETLWAGAGTHDIGLEKDQRNGKMTHKIDPEVDKERDYIGSSLQAAGAVAKLVYLTPSQPVKEAKTATGGSFRSDGRTLIIILTPATLDTK